MSVVISVIIVSYNDREKLIDCLKSLRQQSYPVENTEIIVVDDGSTDGTAEAVGCSFPEVQVITKENSGADNSRNDGIRSANGEIIAFIDADCVAVAGWLQNIVHRLQRSNAYLVGGRITHRGSLAERIIGVSDFGEFQGSEKRYVHNIPTCNMAGKRDIFNRFQFHAELGIGGDVLFCNSIRKAGGKIFYDPAIEVEHRPATTMGEFWKRACRYGESFVLLRRLQPDLPYSVFVRRGIPGIVAVTMARALLDWYRLIRWRKDMEFKTYEIVPAMSGLFFKRLLSLQGAFKAYRSQSGNHAHSSSD